ncbi:LOW QUALITY PROTEIN: hypothetical protein OSB04_021521 [Centaurea solstitialis]|uniref:Uncharacterized protein n=1 Tax=Centaurea solstitialis TaxID=347529 RepID=A0AA38TE37_9ASTR|nr:LOW QUALITY PROTEIN: hypothetical protein OSB04_021521 [Centaurea solstitialis]
MSRVALPITGNYYCYACYVIWVLGCYTDYGGCQVDRKSTSGSCQFLGGKLNCVSTSTAEAEYVAAASCCSPLNTQLRDYGYSLAKIPILCDSKSAIAISANPVQDSKTEHIDIRYHFLKHHVEEGNVEMYFVTTEYQLADLFTKALDEKRFNFLVEKIGMKVKSKKSPHGSQRLCETLRPLQNSTSMNSESGPVRLVLWIRVTISHARVRKLGRTSSIVRFTDHMAYF